MKITREMLHSDLQPLYRLLMIVPSILRFKFFVKLLNFLDAFFRRELKVDGLEIEERFIPIDDGAQKLRLLIFRPENTSDSFPAILYFHGGGYIMGSPEQALEIIKGFIETRQCIVIAPDYRKSFTKPFPAGFNDCYGTLLWAKENAETLNIIPEKFILAGHSAGGGLTAAVTLKARDTRDVDIAFQMPIYPMIDDQQPADTSREMAAPVWNTRMNRLGWGAYLAGLRASGAEIPAYAAPARNQDYRNFPPTITFVGTVEPFYWETAAYVQSLYDAGIDVAYEEYQGCYHGFDFIGGEASISKQARAFTYDNFGAYYDRYVIENDASDNTSS